MDNECNVKIRGEVYSFIIYFAPEKRKCEMEKASRTLENMVRIKLGDRNWYLCGDGLKVSITLN